MSAFCPAFLIFLIMLVSPNGHCHPLENREDAVHQLVKRADQPAPVTTSGGSTDTKFKFGMGYGFNPYMGYPGYGYGYPGYGMPGMGGYGYGGGYGGQYGGQYGGYGFGGAMGGGMYGRR